MTTHKAVGNNRVLRQDHSGTYYKDIVFVPSGPLSMNSSSTSEAATATTTRKEEASEIREFYKNILAMPKTEAQPARRRKAPIVKTISGKAPSGTTTRSESTNISSMPASTAVSQSTGVNAAPSTNSTGPSPLQLTGSSSTVLPPPRSNTTTRAKNTSAAPTTTPMSQEVTSDEIVRRNWSYKRHTPSKDTTTTESSLPPPLKRIIAEGYVLCETCQMEVRKDDLDRHRRGTAHLMSQESPVKPIDALTLGHENKGFRMLVSSGWDYDKGLGAEGQGARHPVATRLKHDRLALGAAGTSKKLVTHTFEEIEKSRIKPTAKSNRRVPLSADDYRKQAEKERKDRVRMMIYMKK
ncbi:G patch domain and ankyrin repeat-containing protein 1 [Mortierella sp. AD032]|nr:G patch domain and ankyrin repeat-containing protein 1 [Mortierella sp. AD032]